MSHRVSENIRTQIREGLTWDALWRGSDKGLIAAWEAGRVYAVREPELVLRARAGEFVELPFKGGGSVKTKLGRRIGALHYLAMWQGLRGDNLELEVGKSVEMTCSKTKMFVKFTDDVDTLLKAES